MSEPDPEDADLRRLMRAYQAGDASAFEDLYGALAPRLRRYLGRVGAGVPDDLLQDTFLRIHRARHSYDASRPVLPWAYAIARHVFLMDRRRRRRTREAPLPAVDAAIPSRERAGAGEEVRQLLDQVDGERREALVLHHVWGFRFAEIAARLGVSEGAARVRVHRALAAIRRFLGRPTP